MRAGHHLDIPMLCHHHGPLSLLLSWTTGTGEWSRPSSDLPSGFLHSIFIFLWQSLVSKVQLSNDPVSVCWWCLTRCCECYSWSIVNKKKYPLRLNYGPGSVKAMAQQTPASSTMSPGTENAQEFSQIFWTGAMPRHDVYHPTLRGVFLSNIFYM